MTNMDTAENCEMLVIHAGTVLGLRVPCRLVGDKLGTCLGRISGVSSDNPN